MKKISVIIPVYNIEISLIKRCLLSIAQQRYDAYEIFLMVNGGTKGYYELVQQQEWDVNVNIIYLDKAGVSNARNQGLKRVTGEYVVFIDGDDIIYPNYFQEAVSLMEMHELDMISGGFSYLYKNGEIPCLCKKDFKVYTGKEKQRLLKVLLAGNMGQSKEEFGRYLLSSPCAKMYRKSAIANVEFLPEVYKFEDLIYIYELVHKLNRIGIVKKNWYGYYQYSGSAIHKKNDCKLVDNNYMVMKQLQKLGIDDSLQPEYMFFCMQGIKDCFFQNKDLTSEERKVFDKKMSEMFFQEKKIQKQIAQPNAYYANINKHFAKIIKSGNIHRAWRFIRLNLCVLSLIGRIQKKTLKCYERTVID